MKKRSLVLVTVDCLRADHVGYHGYARAVTPFLDSLAKQSFVFSDAIVAGVPTYFSFPAIMASRYALGLGRNILGLAPNETTIATTLREAGYKTAAFVAGNPYLSARFGYDQGFDTFQDFLKQAAEPFDPTASQHKNLSALNQFLAETAGLSHLTGAAYRELHFWYCQWRASRQRISIDKLRPYPAADVIVDQACSWLRSVSDENVFLWIHLMDPHHPHYPPAEALSALGYPNMTLRRARVLNNVWNRRDLGPSRLKSYRTEILSLYDASIRWVDQQISRLVRALQEVQLWDDSLFVVTADHGEEFLERGARYHSPANSPEQLIHVPLLVHASGIPPGCFSEAPFSLIHLAPTMLDGMGLPVPSSFEGTSRWKQILAQTAVNEPAIVETIGTNENLSQKENRMQFRVLTIRDTRYKLVLRFKEGKDELYDLKNDPEERAPLTDSASTSERTRLLKLAAEHLRKSREGRNADLALRARLHEIRQSFN